MRTSHPYLRMRQRQSLGDALMHNQANESCYRPDALFKPPWLLGVFMLSSNYLSHGGLNKVSGK